MEVIKGFFLTNLYKMASPISNIEIRDIVEICILSFIVYRLMVWIRDTRAWTLLKGILLLGFFVLMANIFELDTIKFLINKGMSVAIMAAMVVFQPELRRALEELGEKKIFSSITPFDNMKEVRERFSDKTINELVKATVEMAKVKTGALIVLENNVKLYEYERTGIKIDSIVSSQLMINIFEHNTPLHDGAVIVRGDRIVSATCYLPLSDNMALSKELGTRHRAAVGISEETDSLTIIVSEETGHISVAMKGKLLRNVDTPLLREQLVILQNKSVDTKKFRLWKGKGKHEEKRGE